MKRLKQQLGKLAEKQVKRKIPVWKVEFLKSLVMQYIEADCIQTPEQRESLRIKTGLNIEQIMSYFKVKKTQCK